MKPSPNPDSSDDILDRLLREHFAGNSGPLVPSSGFASSVMESIESQAAAPPPLVFPWRRVLPGLLTIFCCLIAFVVVALRTGVAGVIAWAAAQPVAQLAPALARPFSERGFTLSPGELSLCWVIVAAFLAFAAVAASFRLTHGGR